MAGPSKKESRLGDASVILIGSILAGASAIFAGAMIYSGPLAPGRDFNLVNLAANRQNNGSPFGAEVDAADPIITGSINEVPVVDSPAQVPLWFRQPGRKISYRLRSAAPSSALVDVSSGVDAFIYKVEVGELLPGLGRVQAIDRRNGKWQIVTQRTRISRSGAELVREQGPREGGESSQ